MVLLSPSAQAAGSATPENVWLCPGAGSEAGAPAVILNYKTFEIVYEADQDTVPAATEWQKLASELTQEATSVTSVLGVPALLIEPSTDSQGIQHPGVVEFRIDGDSVTVRGDTSSAALMAIAQSLVPVSG